MKIHCISCNSVFRFDSRIINPIGSLVRCSKCQFIFIVYPQEFGEQPKTKNTNIDQSILDDLFNMEHASRAELPFDEITKEWNNLFAKGGLTIKDFNEEVAEESGSDTVGTDSADLPDLSEYENMIDWEDNKDSRQPSVAAG